MIERSLLYIYTAGGTPRFVGCGVLVEGPHVATCRHVWRMATQAEGAETDAVVIEFPHAYQQGERVRTRGTLTDPCEVQEGPRPDLVLLAADAIPSGVMALPLAADARFETGEAWSQAALPSRTRAGQVVDVTIKGEISDAINADGVRQFTGCKSNEYWFERGSSGSPLFLDSRAQQLAGIATLSELGSVEGKSHLHEAFVVRGQTIREHVRRVAALPVAREGHVSAAALREILAAEGMHDVPTADIPARLRQFLAEARAHAAGPAQTSNQGGDIDAAISAARRLVGDLRTDDALALLRARVEDENRAHAQRQLPLLREMLTVQRIALDHDGVRATLGDIARLDVDDAWVRFEIGDAWLLAGNLGRALEAYRDGHAVATRTGETRDLSVSHNKIGNVLLAQGDGPGALDAYRTSLAIADTLARSDPANTDWQRDLSISHNKIGEVLRARGDGPGALKAYRTSLAIADTLARSDPANTNWQRDLSVSYEGIGEVLRAQGDRPGALDAYRTSLAIADTLARGDPTNTEWQRDLSVCHNKVGDVLLAQGDGPGALDAYRVGLAIRETLARRDPANTDWQRDLSVSHNKIGDVLWAQSDGPGALKAHRTSLAIADILGRRDPANTDWQRDLIISHVRLSAVSPADARNHLQQASDIAHRLYDTGRLAPIDHWMVADLDRRLADL